MWEAGVPIGVLLLLVQDSSPEPPAWKSFEKPDRESTIAGVGLGELLLLRIKLCEECEPGAHALGEHLRPGSRHRERADVLHVELPGVARAKPPSRIERRPCVRRAQAVFPACMPFESVQILSTASLLMRSLSSSLQSRPCEHIQARSYMSRAVVVRLSRAIFSDTFSSRRTVLICGRGPP